MSSVKKYVAELFGTMVLVIFGCGVAAVSGCDSAVFNTAYVGTAATFGLVIVGMAYCVGNISGCHINPAVSLAVLISGKMSVKDFCGYVIAQIAGGFIGAAFLKGILPAGSALGSNALFNGDIMMSALIEVVLTCVFVFVILGVTSRKSMGNVAGLVIGGALFLVHLLGIHFTGTSVNPARSLGVAVLSGNTNGLLVFIVAPMIGAAVAALLWQLIGSKDE